MTNWRPQLYEKHAREAGVDAIVLAHALKTAEQLHSKSPNLPPVFTLAHLAHSSGVEYRLLRRIVERTAPEPYRIFRIHKRPSGSNNNRYRVIAVPSFALMKAQRWINQEILAKVYPHPSSVAFAKGNTLVAAAELHCGCRWLVKMDVQNFFESISEIMAFRVFKSLGYQPLISFELARICTRQGGRSRARSSSRWQVHYSLFGKHRWPKIQAYQVQGFGYRPLIGHLPQGAPTSPMLANLAMRDFDNSASKIAQEFGMNYTRYADDITLSTQNENFSKHLGIRLYAKFTI